MANIIFVRRTGPGGMPGTLAYQLNALHVSGTSVPLWRAEGRSGDPKVPGAEALIPVAGMFTLFRHGKDVELKPGISVTAFVAATPPFRCRSDHHVTLFFCLSFYTHRKVKSESADEVAVPYRSYPANAFWVAMIRVGSSAKNRRALIHTSKSPMMHPR